MTAGADIQAQASPASLKALIAAAGAELSALACQGHRLQGLIGEHVAARGAGQDAIEDAQLLDVLLQHHEALAEVLTRLAEQIPSAAEVDLGPVLGGLRLAGLADRLSGTDSCFVDAAGELEVF